MGLFSFTQEIAMDLGTANTIITTNGKIVVDEPSVVALDRRTDKMIAVGDKAKMMHEKTHENIRTIRPLRDGVIADFYACEQMIRGLIKMVNNRNRLGRGSFYFIRLRFQPVHLYFPNFPSEFFPVCNGLPAVWAFLPDTPLSQLQRGGCFPAGSDVLLRNQPLSASVRRRSNRFRFLWTRRPTAGFGWQWRSQRQ